MLVGGAGSWPRGPGVRASVAARASPKLLALTCCTVPRRGWVVAARLQVPGSGGLTSHSSRCRFAARLNSGVMRIQMSKYTLFLFAVLMISSATSCTTANDAVDPSFKAALGWILVENGSVADVKAAISDYDGLVREERPGLFRVELHLQSSGAVAVVLPDGFPAYDLANMTGWLSAPPDQEDVYGAVSWITAPGNGIKYYLEPETSNSWGDTLIGASAAGQPVRVSLPETGMSEVSSIHLYKEEPEIEISQQPVKIEVTLDTNTGFGNPEFMVNSPKDHDWGR